MSSPFSVTFLGTSSGGGPSATRNCSALICDMRLRDGSLWLVDCAEGTMRQFALQPRYLRYRMDVHKVAKIFITHMHVDHIMGLVPLLRNILWPPATGGSAAHHPPKLAVEVYGPAGLRMFVRQNLKMTFTRTNDKYTVHELLTDPDSITPCEPTSEGDHAIADTGTMHSSEVAGEDIRCSSEDGLWRAITRSQGSLSEIVVDAGPIHHRDPCIGYVFFEVEIPSRKLVILGDTHDPSPIFPLCINPSPSLLIHEATDSHITRQADPSGRLSRRTPAEVEAKALSRGHSVPQMAGQFARRVDARQLVLNHIGGRFPAPTHPRDFATMRIMQNIEENASQSWGQGRRAVAATDYSQIFVPAESLEALNDKGESREEPSEAGGHRGHEAKRPYRGRGSSSNDRNKRSRGNGQGFGNSNRS